MTKFGDARCLVCRIRLRETPGPGRPREYCSAACRQRHWVASQGEGELQRAEAEVRELRRSLDELLDDVAAALDALEAEWAVEPGDPLRAALHGATVDALAPLRTRLRR